MRLSSSGTVPCAPKLVIAPPQELRRPRSIRSQSSRSSLGPRILVSMGICYCGREELLFHHGQLCETRLLCATHSPTLDWPHVQPGSYGLVSLRCPWASSPARRSRILHITVPDDLHLLHCDRHQPAPKRLVQRDPTCCSPPAICACFFSHCSSSARDLPRSSWSARGWREPCHIPGYQDRFLRLKLTSPAGHHFNGDRFCRCRNPPALHLPQP